MPIIANGGINELQIAVNMLEGEQADYMAPGKIALSNQDWPNIVRHSGALKAFDDPLRLVNMSVWGIGNQAWI